MTDSQFFQGHYLKDVTVVIRTEQRTFPTGSFFVPTAQPKANLISYLLEPETDDSLATWNYLDVFIQVRGGGQATEAGARRGGGRGQGRGRGLGQRGGGRRGGGQRGGRGGFGRGRRGGQGGPGQSTRTYRLMEVVDIKGTLVNPANYLPKNRYTGR